jgi:hypothetical protein
MSARGMFEGAISNIHPMPVGEVKRLSYEEEKEEGHPSRGEIGQEVQSPRSKQRER